MTYGCRIHNTGGYVGFSRINTVFLIILAGMAFMGSRFFLVKHVELIKPRSLLPEEILLSAGISRKQTIFQIRPRKIERRILDNPVIAEARVSVIFPDKVRIIVKERVPLFKVRYNKRYACIGRDGTVMGFSVERAEYPIPLVRGCSVTSCKTGEMLKSGRGAEAIRLLSYTDYLLKKSLQVVDLNHFRLYLKSTGNQSVPVELGNFDELERKLANLRAIMHQGNINRITAIDLRIPDIPTAVFK